MLNRFIFLLFALNFVIINLYSSNEKIGASRLYFGNSSNEDNFFIRLESNLQAAMSDVSPKDLYALNIRKSLDELKKALKIWKDSTTDISDTDTGAGKNYFDLI